MDGRPYADESFLAALNDYHQSAARAHREHSQEQLHLPELVAVPAPVPPWAAGVIVADTDPPGLNGHNGADRCLTRTVLTLVSGSTAMHAGLRARQLVNLANGSTLAGLGVAVLGRARVARSADGLFLGTGYRLPVPPAPAFCLGNVIVTRLDGLDPGVGALPP